MKLELQEVSFSYQPEVPVLRNVSFTAQKGHVVAVLGPNGAGKTTLLKCLLGFLKISSGRVLLDGRDTSTLSAREFWQHTAYVPQARMQAFSYTCFETVLMGRGPYLGFFQMPSAKDEEICEAAMKRAGVWELRDKSCQQISGGELQLVLIARALAGQPQLLVMDEPETGLDFRNQLRVLNLIQELSSQEHLTILLNTHYPEHAYEVAQETVLLQKGGTSLFGSTKDILTPAHMKEVFGVEVVIKKENAGGREYMSIIPTRLVEEEEEK